VSIEVRNLSFAYDGPCVLREVSFRADGGELVAVLGPNGVGKSTLFRCMLGFLKPRSGEVVVDGRRLADIPRREVAQRIAYIPQSAPPAFNYTVTDVVLMGFTNRIGVIEMPGPEHTERAVAVLEELGIAHLRHRGFNRISGGERQLALLGRALAQDTAILLMDEPVANLDYSNQHRLMELLNGLAGRGYTVVFSTHDPNLALHHAGRVLALKGGRLILDGKPEAVLTESSMEALYGIGVSLCTVEAGGRTVTVSVPRGATS